MKMRLVSALLTIAALAACQAAPDAGPSHRDAAKVAPAAGPQATVEERLLDTATRRVLRLSNGFTVILQQNKTAPVVAARVYVKAGALTEQQYMAAGISHVCEHLVAGATSGKRGEDANTLLLQQIGNDSNAYTDEDHTCYFITTTAEKWPVALDLLIDWTTHADFTRAQFDREYKVVQREIEMDEAEADRVFYTHTQSNRYLVSPARHPVIGYKPVFQKITYEDCKNYYKQMYVPDNMIVSIAGDIDLDTAQKTVLGQLGGVARRGVPAIALPPEPLAAAPRTSVSHADIRQARVEWAFPTMTLYDPDLYATDVLASVLGGSESSLLVRKLRDELGVVVGISASHPTPAFAPGELIVDAVLPAEKISAAREALFAVLDGVLEKGVPQDAIDRAKAGATAAMVFGDQTAEQQASRNALDFINTGNIDFTELYAKRIQAVTAEQVRAAARKYLDRQRLLTTVVLPLQTNDSLAQGAGDGAATQAATAPATRVSRRVLKNGLTLLISRNPAAPLASFQLYTMGGLLAEDDSNNGTGRAMMEMMTRGTTTRSHEQIADFLDATGTTLSAESGNNTFSLSVECMKAHAAEAFGLFADVALHPRILENNARGLADEFDQLRPQLLAAIDATDEEWFGEAYRNLRGTYWASSPYKRLAVGSEPVVAALGVGDLRDQYRGYFLDPQKMVLAISGDIDPAAAAQWAAPFEEIPMAAPMLASSSRRAPGHVARFPTGKQSATVMFGFPGIRVNSPDRYAVTLLQTYLGGYSSPGGSLLHETLRGKGLVYTVQAEEISGPAGGMFLITALGEPGNVTQIVSNIQELIARVRRGEIPEAALAAAKEQAITGLQLSKQTIGEKNAAEALDELMGLGFDEDARFPARIRALSKDDVVRAAQRYLVDPTIAITTPEQGKSGS
jgi:zinc protease